MLLNIFIFCFQFTSEVYPTKLRMIGVGLANGIGKSSGIFMPFLVGFLESK